MSFFDGDGAATLIAARGLLTAAHTAANLPPGHTVVIAGRRIAIADAVPEPGGDDLALVELERAPEGVAPLALHDGADETGAELLLLGRGDFGNGRDGVLGVDHRLRGVTNRVDAVDDRWLRMRFDAPPEGTALEGVGGEGDSGGPALLRTDEGLVVVGVSSWQDHDGPLGTYGAVEHYARVAPHLDWLRAVSGAR